ncbi:MAG: bifunctional precorrin-2 dehydrogenase/sirohydrochlorin ferrochelatase [Dehalococcoidia bacterium]
MRRGNHISPYYPIFLGISGKRCVVVGGGPVALRKVGALLEHEADVEVISPDLCPELTQMAEKGTIHILHREYDSGDLQGAFIAIAATDNGEINRKVAEEARERGVLVNVVDDPEHSDFIVPSYLRRGAITIAVSTAGKSPALARRIRTQLEKEFGAEYISLALLIDEVRSELKRQGVKVDGDSWQEAIDLDVLLEMLRAGQSEKAKAALLTNLERLRRTKA